MTEDLVSAEEDGVYIGTIPHFYAKSLIPTFESNAVRLFVNKAEQISGVTARDFSASVIYSFVGEKGTIKELKVKLNFLNMAIPHIYIYNRQEVIEKEKYLNASIQY